MSFFAYYGQHCVRRPAAKAVISVDHHRRLIYGTSQNERLGGNFLPPKIVLDFLIDREIEAFRKTIYDDHYC